MTLKHLILIPTHFEYLKLKGQVKAFDRSDVQVSICGFGPVAAAARAGMLISKHEPSHVWNLGIAGSLSDQACVGEAFTFASVAMHGIGAGEGEDHISAVEMDWHFWAGDTEDKLDQDETIGSQLPLVGAANGECGLLSVCAASASADQAKRRKEKHPSVIAEDMESFGIALACKLASVPLTVIRGISNVAGDRDMESWEVDKALAAVAELANDFGMSQPDA